MFGKSRAYLDWASAAPVGAAAARAYARGMHDFGNPSSPHAEGRAGKAALEDARTRIARLVGAKADDVIFTSGATEANNLGIAGHARALINGDNALGSVSVIASRAPHDIHILYLPSAHASVVETVQALAALGCAVEPLAIKDGAIDISALAKQLRPQTALVVIDAVCGETGAIWNAREVRRALNECNDACAAGGMASQRALMDSPPGEKPFLLPSRVLLYVDASQAPLSESIERSRFGADLMVLDASKVGGVRGIGALIASRTIPLAPIFHGGGQEHGFRPGTESPALAAAFAAALEECAERRDDFAARASRARRDFLARLSSANLPNLFTNEGKHQAPHILNCSFVGRDTDYLVALLDEASVAVSTKSACETDSETGSRAVFALTQDAARAASTLRISWGPATSERDLERAFGALIKSVRFLDVHDSSAR